MTCCVDGCTQPVYQKRDRLCRKHYAEQRSKMIHPANSARPESGHVAQPIKTYKTRRGAYGQCSCGWTVAAVSSEAADTQLQWHVDSAS